MDLIIVWICLVIFYPFTISQIFPVLGIHLSVLISFSLVIFGLALKRPLRHFPKLLNQLILFQIIGWLTLYLLHFDSTYFTRIIFLFLAYLLLLFLYNNQGLYKFIDNFNKVMTLMGVFGCITFLGVLLFDINPLLDYVNVDGRNGYFYGLTCTNMKIHNVIRYSGFFDEPGAMAAWGMYALIFNKLFSKNKIISWVLPITLFFTFSLAFYIQYFLYICFFGLKKIKHVILLCLVLGITCLFIISTKESDYSTVYEMTLGRFEFNEATGTISGNNRSDLSETAKKVFFESPFIGKGPQIITSVPGMSDNPFENLATDGIIGTFIMYFPLFFLAIYYDSKNLRFAILILIAGYLQRPFHSNLIHPFILYLFVLTSIMTFSKNGNIKKNLSNYGYLQCGKCH